MDVETTEWNRVRYDLLAPFYDLATKPLMDGRRRSLELLAPQSDERLLVLGAGTGLDFPLLPHDVRAVGIDVSPGMLRRAKRRARERPIEVALMDGERLAFADASFDAAVLHLILAVIPDPVAAAREVARVVRPGGRVVVFDKFLPEDEGPSSARVALNRLARVVATDINRHAHAILDPSGLQITYEEPSAMRGFFRILLAHRP